MFDYDHHVFFATILCLLFHVFTDNLINLSFLILVPNVNIHDQTLLPSEDDRNEEFERKPFDLLNGPESYKYLASALDGFLLILSGEGDVTYVSESISDYLGISQVS